jgi:hypothetical protein
MRCSCQFSKACRVRASCIRCLASRPQHSSLRSPSYASTHANLHSAHLRTGRTAASLGRATHILRELGGGGITYAFVARGTAACRHLVVQMPSPKTVAGVSNERFLREFELAASPQHPRIVPRCTRSVEWPIFSALPCHWSRVVIHFSIARALATRMSEAH